ncbi:MAG: TetR/AcrR family transcriptional regulator [Acidimicrobiales bacterium]
MPPTAPDTRARLLEATYECIARQGLAATSLEDAARSAGVSRATLYRYFPGGRDELLAAVISFETLRFFLRLADAVAEAPDLEAVLVDGIVFAHRAVEEHEVLQRLLSTEPELLTPQLSHDTPRILNLLQTFFVGRFGGHELREGVPAAAAAEYVARMTLSFISSPGRWDLSDRDQVRTLVRSEILAGVAPVGATSPKTS